MAKVEWIRLSTDMFNNPKIKYIRTLPEGNNILLIWVMLLTKAGICNSHGYIMLTENVPYTSKMLADELGFDENIVQFALATFSKLDMISIENNELLIVGWEEHQNVEGLDKIRERGRLRTQKCRERKKQIAIKNEAIPCNVTGNATVTHGNALEEEKEKENIYIEQIHLLWSLYPNKKGKAIAFKKLPKLIERYGFEQIKRCVERYALEQKGKDKQYIAHGSTFFNNTYVDYLDENYGQGSSHPEQPRASNIDPETGEVLEESYGFNKNSR